MRCTVNVSVKNLEVFGQASLLFICKFNIIKMNSKNIIEFCDFLNKSVVLEFNQDLEIHNKIE